MPVPAGPLDVEIWASSGDRKSPEDLGLTWSEGWPVAYEQVGGSRPQRTLFNALLHYLTSWLRGLLQTGLFPWDAAVDYAHTSSVRAFVMGSDGVIYRSREASGPASGNSTDPTTARQTVWEAY